MKTVSKGYRDDALSDLRRATALMKEVTDGFERMRKHGDDEADRALSWQGKRVMRELRLYAITYKANIKAG